MQLSSFNHVLGPVMRGPSSSHTAGAESSADNGTARLTARRRVTLPDSVRRSLLSVAGSVRLWESAPVYFVQTGQPLFTSASQLVQIAEERGLSLGRLALAYEAELLGMSEAEVMQETLRCTSKGGLAVTPSAQALTPRCCHSGCASCP